MIDIFETNAGQAYISHESINAGSIQNRYVRDVPRGDVGIMAVTGLKKIRIEGSKLIIPEQEQSDSIFLYCRKMRLDQDEAVDTATLHKHFAVLNISLDKPEEDIGDYAIRIRGGIAGIDAFTCEPIEGTFTYEPVSFDSEGTKYSVRIPRQNDGSLQMDLLRDGEMMDKLSIGKKILESGYSWEAADLDDIWVNVDCAHLNFSLTIINWEEGFNGNWKL